MSEPKNKRISNKGWHNVMIVRRGIKVWEGLAHTKPGEAMGIDLSPEEKAGLGKMQTWEGTLDRGQAQGSKFPKERPSTAYCTRAKKGSVCTGEFMKEARRDKVGRDRLNKIFITLKVGLNLDFTL